MDALPRLPTPAGPASVGEAPRLTAERERELVVAAEAGDPEASLSLVRAFLPNITALARRFRHALGVEQRDLVQEGVTALLFAARRYDTQQETPFWAYASYWVRKAMQELVADSSRAVALSDRAVRSLATLRAARSDHQAAHGREPTVEELASATGFTHTQVHQLLAADGLPLSLEAPVAAGESRTLADRIADPAAEAAYDVVLDDLELHQVRTAWETLDERDLFVLRARYGVGGPARNLREIGAELGLSAERARQIEAGALARVRAMLVRSAPTGDPT